MAFSKYFESLVQNTNLKVILALLFKIEPICNDSEALKIKWGNRLINEHEIKHEIVIFTKVK